MCFVKSDITFSTLDTLDIPSVPVSNSEFLCLYLESFYTFVICVYHPFWENQTAHDAAISMITTLIDFAHVKFGSELKILLCGDFNGLRVRYDEISQLTRLSSNVDFPTRGSNTLDQFFSNFRSDQKPVSSPPPSDALIIK